MLINYATNTSREKMRIDLKSHQITHYELILSTNENWNCQYFKATKPFAALHSRAGKQEQIFLDIHSKLSPGWEHFRHPINKCEFLDSLRDSISVYSEQWTWSVVQIAIALVPIGLKKCRTISKRDDRLSDCQRFRLFAWWVKRTNATRSVNAPDEIAVILKCKCAKIVC